jgi:capsular polysaccharide export protein
MTAENPRTILFLQGPPSTFWPELARGFEAHGHRTVKINVCFGDDYFWRRRGAYHFRGLFRRWPAYLERIVRREAVTDIVYFADRQPYHVEAQALGRRLGIPCYAVEFGYLRPEWLTLEREGMSAFSHFPADPDVIRELARGLPPPPEGHYPHDFAQEAYGEVAFHLFSEFARPAYPFYRSDRYYHAFHDYLAWLAQLARGPAEAKRADATIARIEKERTPFFLVALQLQSDYQIRTNSPYNHIREMLAEVIDSFAANAGAGEHLVFKQHPLDNGWENWPKVVRRIARRAGVEGRVHVIAGGNLQRLIAMTRGTVIINSTVGLQSLRGACPTKVLGVAVYDIAGLTDQQPLDDFWREPQPVDTELMQDFERLIAATIQVKGSFYNRDGRAAAVVEIVRRIENNLVNEPGAYVERPPRLTRARNIGVPLPKTGRPADDRVVGHGELAGSSR